DADFHRGGLDDVEVGIRFMTARDEIRHRAQGVRRIELASEISRQLSRPQSLACRNDAARLAVTAGDESGEFRADPALPRPGGPPEVERTRPPEVLRQPRQQPQRLAPPAAAMIAALEGFRKLGVEPEHRGAEAGGAVH